MKHFGEVRNEVKRYFREHAELRQLSAAICLIWDLQGRLRLLLKLRDGRDAEAVRGELATKMTDLAFPFWTGDVWIWLPDCHKEEKAVYEKAWTEARVLDAGPPEIRVLERHVSKESWFVPRIRPPWPLNEHTPPILSFYSFKGGVGRTTALMSLAIQLARSGRRVAMVDLDLEAPGLMSALPPPKVPRADGTEPPGGPPCGALDYLLEKPLVPDTNEIDLSEFYYIVDDPKVIADGVPITVVPAGQLDADYLQKLARLDYGRLYALSSGERASSSPLLGLLKSLRRQRRADYILLDSRAGFNDMGGLALSGISHLDLVFGLNTEQSWKGLELVVRFLGRDRVEAGLSQLDCLLVHTMAPWPGPEREAVVEYFKERAHDLFSDEYYDEEGGEGEWPVPGPDDTGQPHYPVVLGFDERVKWHLTIADVADRIVEGDFRSFAEQVLSRVGRSLI